MAKVCENCGRGSMKSNSRSHSNIATIRRQHLNLQYARINGKRMRVCAWCLKTVHAVKK